MEITNERTERPYRFLPVHGLQPQPAVGLRQGLQCGHTMPGRPTHSRHYSFIHTFTIFNHMSIPYTCGVPFGPKPIKYQCLSHVKKRDNKCALNIVSKYSIRPFRHAQACINIFLRKKTHEIPRPTFENPLPYLFISLFIILYLMFRCKYLCTYLFWFRIYRCVYMCPCPSPLHHLNVEAETFVYGFPLPSDARTQM